MNYDIHTYWSNEDERNEALNLKKILIDNQIQTFSMVDQPIGPHPLPMFEAHVSSQRLPAIEALLVANRVNCSILIHEKTGDHMYDHTKGARWLGKPLDLNLEFLRNFHG
jgi:DOPA 4,5-dioxygenase